MLFFCFRQVSPGDIQAIEKRLMQTMDLIVVKKKRIALAKRGVQVHGSQSVPTSPSLWNMIRTVTSKETPESILFLSHLTHYAFVFFLKKTFVWMKSYVDIFLSVFLS